MMPSLSATMVNALAYLQQHRVLVRAPGGYWTADGKQPDYAAYKRGEWVGTRTVEALVNRGYARLPDGEDLNGNRGARNVFITKAGCDYE